MSEQVPVKHGDSAEATRQRAGESRFEPLRDLTDLWERVRRSAQWPAPPWPGDAWRPLVDVEETAEAYVVEVELPGARREDVQVDVGGDELSITGEVKGRERTGVVRHRTRRTGSFRYRTTLPSGADPDRAEARFADGVLTVRVPRAEQSRPRRVRVV